MAGYYSSQGSWASAPSRLFEESYESSDPLFSSSSIDPGAQDDGNKVKHTDSACSTDIPSQSSQRSISTLGSQHESGNGSTGSRHGFGMRPGIGSRHASDSSLLRGDACCDVPSDKIPGATSATFQVRSVLGKGAFGTVYKVAEKSTGRSFAMKVLQKDAIFEKGILRYAVSERSVQSRMSRHPFIVGLVCAFQTKHELVLVMQFCGGGTLERLVKGQGGLSEEVSRLYFSEVFLAIEHLHACNVAYRDLKCENVVLDDQGHAMLTDFGLAKENILGPRSTDTFVGSAAFLAPEIVNLQRYGKEVDLWGLGVVLFEMLTTLPPFYSISKRKTFDSIKSAELKVPSSVTEDCEAILRALLDRDPERRLGAGDTAAIRRHRFLEGHVDFEAVLRREAPVPPPLSRRPAKGAHAKTPDPFQHAARGMGGAGIKAMAPRHHHVAGWEYPVPAPEAARGWRRACCLIGIGSKAD